MHSLAPKNWFQNDIEIQIRHVSPPVFCCFWFSRGFGQIAKNHGKTKQRKKVQTYVPSQASPQTLPMGLNFGFFCFLEVLAKLQKHENTKKTKKTRSSDPCPQAGLSPDLAHGSELFISLFLVSWGFGQIAKNMETQKKQKPRSSDPCPQPGLSPDLAHGLNFWFFWFLEVLAKLQKTMETKN